MAPAVEELLQRQLDEIPKLKDLSHDRPEFMRWRQLTSTIVTRFFGEKKANPFDEHNFHSNIVRVGGMDNSAEDQRAFNNGLGRSEASLRALIDEATILGLEEVKPKEKKDVSESTIAPSALRITINNTQTNEQVVSMNVNLAQVMEAINQAKASEDEKKVAREKAQELESELKNEHPNWDRVKPSLVWLLNFSKDAFVAVIPYILTTFK